MANDPSLRPLLNGALLIDGDVLKSENLALSRLYRRAADTARRPLLGQPKVQVVSDYLQALFGLSPRPCPLSFADLSWVSLQPLRLLISCTDNALARVEASLASRTLGIPLLDGAVLGSPALGGRATWFSAQPQAACYLCGLREDRRAELLTFGTALSLGCHLPETPPLGTDPQLSTPLARTASTLLDIVRRFIRADAEQRVSEEFSSSWALRLPPLPNSDPAEHVTLTLDPACPLHEARRLPLVLVYPDQPFRELLLQQGAERPGEPPHRLQFAWPICLASVCRACGAADTRPRRLAAVRQAVCLNCKAAATLEPLQTLSSVGHNDPMANRTPRQLGWDQQQLMQLRPTRTPATREGNAR